MDCITFERLKIAITCLAEQRGIYGDPLANPPALGTGAEELQAAAIFLDLPPDLRMAARDEATRMSRAVVMSRIGRRDPLKQVIEAQALRDDNVPASFWRWRAGR